jgi:hypothetical protein
MLMNTLVAKIESILTGGQSDFAMMLNHRWHGIDLYAPLVFGGGLCFFAAAVCLALFILQWGKWRRTWLLLIAAFAFATAAYAASSTLGNLSAGSAISSTDLFYDVQTVGTGGVKVTGAQLQTFLPGTVTSIATGCQATGGTITTTGTISTIETPTTLSGSNPAITTGYCGGLENLSNSSAQTPTIAEAGTTGFTTGWYTDLCNINTGAQTLTPAAGTIGGASSYPIAAGTVSAPTCVRIISDGVSNYLIAFPGGGSGPTLAGNNVWTGNNSFTQTTAPSMAAGSLFLGGTYGSNPTTGTNGEGAIWIDTTNGVTLQGKGSANGRSVTIDDSNGNPQCYQGGSTWNCGSVAVSGGGGGFSHFAQSNGTINEQFQNGSNGASAIAQIQLGNNNNATEATLSMYGGSYTTAALQNVLQINGGDVTNGGGVQIQSQGTTGFGLGGAGLIKLYNQTNITTALAYNVCAATGANGTGGGQMELDGTNGCLTSTMLVKHGIAAFTPSGEERLMALATPIGAQNRIEKDFIDVDAAAEIMKLVPVEFTLDAHDPSPQFGLTAQDACQIDERMCDRFADGTPRAYRPNAVISLLVATVQKQQKEIDALTRQINSAPVIRANATAQ